MEGLTRDGDRLGAVQQAFKDCHGLQCGFCTPGFLVTVTAGSGGEPTPRCRAGPRDRRRQPVPLHRIPEHRRCRAACRRAGRRARQSDTGRGARRGARRRSGRMTSKMFGEPIARVEDERMLRGHGSYLDDLGHDALEMAVLRSPHAHARIIDIDVDAALDVPGLVAIYTYDDMSGPLADPLPLLIPHPDLTHGRTQYALARDEVNYVGEAGRRRRGERPVPRRGRGRADRGVLPAAAGRGRHRCRAGGRAPGARGRAGQPGGSDGPVHRRRRCGDRRSTAPAGAGPDGGAQRLHSVGGPRACWPGGTRWPPACRCGPPRRPRPASGQPWRRSCSLDIGQVDVIAPDIGGGFGVKIVHPWPEEVLVPFAASGAEPAGEVHGGPPRALHLRGARARPATPHRGRVRRRRPGPRARRAVLARPRRLHPVRPDRADHHLDPAARPVQAGCVHRGVRASTRTP